MKQIKTNNKNLFVCLRCGAVGAHSTENCHANVPSFEFLEQEINTRLEDAYSQVPPAWKSDRYGLYVPSKQKSFFKEGQPNCSNCGEFGHTTDQCDKPNRDQVHDMYLASSKNNGSNDDSEDFLIQIQNKYYNNQ